MPFPLFVSGATMQSMAKPLEMNFCPCCGHALEDRFVFGRTRRKCPQCDFVFFRDPKVAAGVLIEDDERVLLVKRLYDPHLGDWALPAGFRDRRRTGAGCAA